MKNLTFLLITLLVLSSCKKETGTVLYKINFIDHDITSAGMIKRSLSSDRYTQFGDFITSLTPTKFTAKIWTVGYIDKVMERSNNNANMLQYIEQNGDKLNSEDPSRLVDFTDNNVVSFNPVIYGRVNNDKQFEDEQIDFSYFYFIPFHFYQEIPLPSGYQNVTLDMFPAGSSVNNILKVRHNAMMQKIFPNAWTSGNIYLIFGNTESSFVVNPNGETVSLSEDCPIAEPGHDLTIRSHKYTNMVFNQPGEGQTAVMDGTLSFNTLDLIQVYAGTDNIPYTHDDIFVYAPKFWERINSKLEIR
jgi:hypothetical protein